MFFFAANALFGRKLSFPEKLMDGVYSTVSSIPYSTVVYIVHFDSVGANQKYLEMYYINELGVTSIV